MKDLLVLLDSDTTYFDEIDQDRRVCLALRLNRQLRRFRCAGCEDRLTQPRRR